jgi:hypothetical protein
VHGTAIDGQDDRDELGRCLEPPPFVTGLARVPAGIRGEGPSVRFEQYERHTAWDRPGGVANRSGAGDLDVVIYSARKWARLALAGNPTVLLVLFVPDEEVVFRNQAGAELAASAHRFVSRLAAARYLGYLSGQKAAMTGRPGAHIKPHREYLRSIRRGERALAGYSTRSRRPRPGWRGCGTALLSPISRTAAGSTAGCTAATWTSGLRCPESAGAQSAGAGRLAAGWRRSSPRSGRPSRCRPPGAVRPGGTRSPGPA